MNWRTIFQRKEHPVETAPVQEPPAPGDELAAAEARLGELQADFARAREQVDRGDADEEAHRKMLALPQQLVAATRLRDELQNKAHRAKMDAARDAARARALAELEPIAELIPRLLIHLGALRSMMRGGVLFGVDTVAEFGLPQDFAPRLEAAIDQITAGADWHYDWMDGKPTPLPTPKPAQAAPTMTLFQLAATGEVIHQEKITPHIVPTV